MPLFGTLQSMPLPDLLQWLGGARKTGTLQVERNRVRKWILMRDGRIVGCSSDDPPERLGHFLLSRGRITEDQLRIALAAQSGGDKYLGKIFIEMGALTPEDLSAHLEAKAEETIYSVFDWDDAVFRFHEEVTDHECIFQVDLRVEDVLLRGMKRYDDLMRIRETLNDPGMILARTDRRPPEEVFHNNMARSLYEAIDGDRTVAEILLHVHGSEYLVTKFIYELLRNGFLEIVGVREVKAQDPAEIDPALSEHIPQHDLPSDMRTPGTLPDSPSGAPDGPSSGAKPDHLPLTPPAMTDSPADAPSPHAAAAQDGFAMSEEAGSGAVATATAEAAPDSAVGLEPVEASPTFQFEQGLTAARARMNDGNFDQALQILDGLYQKDPNNDSLRRLTAEAEAAFVEKAYRHLVPPSRVPILCQSADTLEQENLSPTEFFMLSRCDGTWDIRSIIQISPIREVEALLTLTRMREKGIIDLKDPGDLGG